MPTVPVDNSGHEFTTMEELLTVTPREELREVAYPPANSSFWVYGRSLMWQKMTWTETVQDQVTVADTTQVVYLPVSADVLRDVKRMDVCLKEEIRLKHGSRSRAARERGRRAKG